MISITENSSFGYVIETTDKDGNPYTPSKIDYVIDDVISGQRIRTKVTVNPSSSITEIAITASDNVILNGLLPFEERMLSYEIYVGSNVVKSDEYRWYVKNLYKIPIQAS